MPLTICLTAEEKALLDRVSHQSARTQDDLIHQSIREGCLRLLEQPEPSPYEVGQELFGTGQLAEAPSDPGKYHIWKTLHAKHRRLG